MKKLWMTCMLLAGGYFGSVSVFAAKLNSHTDKTGVPVWIEDKVYADFGKLDNQVNWDITQSYIGASFERHGRQVTALYKPDGSFIGTVHAISFGKLPSSVQEYIHKKYNGYTVEKTARFEAGEPSTDPYDFTDSDEAYYIQLKNGQQEITLQANEMGAITVVQQ
jgi:hypothetical protein